MKQQEHDQIVDQEHVPMSSDSELLRVLIYRIDQRIKELGTNARKVSLDADLGSTAVHDILNGKNKRPGLATIVQIAKALKCSVADLTGGQPELSPNPLEVELTIIPIIGVAEAGAFREMAEFASMSASDDLPVIRAQRSEHYPECRHFALKVRGDSMNAAKPTPLVDGMVALCVDFVDAGLIVETGRIYALRRTRDGGQTYECTVKRAKVFRDRYEFHPESTGQYETVTIGREDGQDDTTTTIDVIGLVYATFQSLEP